MSVGERPDPAAVGRACRSPGHVRERSSSHRSVLLTPNLGYLSFQCFLQPTSVQQAVGSFTFFFLNRAPSFVSNSLIWKAAGSARKDARRTSRARGNPESPTHGMRVVQTQGRNWKRLQRARCACRCWVAFALYRKIFIFKIRDSGDFVFNLINTELSVALKALHLSRDWVWFCWFVFNIVSFWACTYEICCPAIAVISCNVEHTEKF